MKAEINNENKAKFFALYWGQAVLWEPFIGQDVFVDQHFPWDLVGKDYHYLNLKPLSQISDEDAIELGYSACNDPLNANYGMSASGTFFDDWTQRQDMLMSDSDYLRSKGYALPWMGLDVKELIEAGWIKLIES
jgi:hypothetical protein